MDLQLTADGMKGEPGVAKQEPNYEADQWLRQSVEMEADVKQSDLKLVKKELMQPVCITIDSSDDECGVEGSGEGTGGEGGVGWR